MPGGSGNFRPLSFKESVGVRMGHGWCFAALPIPLPTSPLKGEERGVAGCQAGGKGEVSKVVVGV